MADSAAGPVMLDSDRAKRPRHRWIGVTLVLLAIVWIAGASGVVRIQMLPLTLAVLLALVLVAVVYFPTRGSVARRRWPLVLLLAAPVLASLVCGPFGLGATDPPGAARANALQDGFFAAAAVLPLLLLPAMPGGRRFVLAAGAVGLMLTLVGVAASAIVLAPGS